MLTIAIAEQLLVLAVQSHLIIIGVVRVTFLLAIANENHLATLGINLVNAPGHQTVALGDTVQELARLAVVQVVVAAASAVAPPQHLPTVVYELVLEHIDVDVGTADLADDHADVSGHGVDAAQLQRIDRTAAAQEVLCCAFPVIVHLDEVVGVRGYVELASLAGVGIIPVEVVAANAISVGQRHLPLLQADWLLHLVNQVQVGHVGIVVDHTEVGVALPEAGGITFIESFPWITTTV